MADNLLEYWSEVGISVDKGRDLADEALLAFIDPGLRRKQNHLILDEIVVWGEWDEPLSRSVDGLPQRPAFSRERTEKRDPLLRPVQAQSACHLGAHRKPSARRAHDHFDLHWHRSCTDDRRSWRARRDPGL